MGIKTEIKLIAFMNTLADILIDAGITTAEELDKISDEKEKILLEQLYNIK